MGLSASDAEQVQDLESTLSRNVDGRHCLDLPAEYPGLMVTSTLHTRSLADVVDTPLGEIALELRAALKPSQLKYQLRKQATLLARRTIPPSPSSNPSLDVRLSSWAKEDAYSIGFGLGFGRAGAVRTPRFEKGAREGLVYFLPKTRDASIVVGICLREDDMQVLREDHEMTGRCEYIG